MQLATAVDRHRRPIVLTAVTLTAAALAARAAGADPDPLAAGLAVPLAVALLLVFPIMVAPVWRKRTGLRLDEPTRSFRTPRTGVVPLFGVIHLTLLGILLLIPADTPKYRLIVPVAALALLGYARALWYGLGVTLTADGVHADKYTGSLTFPWEALDPDRPPKVVSHEVEIHYHRPDLIRVTGRLVRRRTVITEGIRPELVAAALRHYLAHPAERARIGTRDGLDRLAEATGDRAELERDTPVWTGRGLAAAVLTALLLFPCAIGIEVWADGRFGEDSAGAVVVHLVTGALTMAAGGLVVEAIRGYRRRHR
ncbi:hypothetical protein Aoc01nite_11910 [Actinoplanes octamycinicus]|nr:hypothetical protein Aoc01nite_11910 [Actinoplanes octamycinicus]